MIVIKLKGGLGNQMFQYSFGRKLANLNKTDLFLELSSYRKKYFKKIIKNILIISLECLKSGRIKKSLQKIRQDKRQYNLKFFVLDNKIKRIYTTNLPEIAETKEFYFDKNLLHRGNNFSYDGYFNNEKYFTDITNIIHEDLKLKKRYQEKIPKELVTKILQSASISLHVRRGDYIHNKKINKFHGTCSITYYKKSIEIIKQKINNPHFFVFSDDIEWCKENLELSIETTFMSNLKNYQDLYLMSLCKHNIIANSTFSWWGAWLNSSPNKIVIAPKKWFNNKKIDIRDLIPKKWIKI